MTRRRAGRAGRARGREEAGREVGRGGAPPVLLTRDAELAQEVERLAAAAGVRLGVAATDGAVLAAWHDAPVILVGADVVDEVAALRPHRREGVQVVGGGRVGDGIYRAAVAVGASEVLALPDAAGWLVETLALHEEPHRAGSTVVVVGGSGGAGASTIAAVLARTAAGRGPALALDLDPAGPGLDRLLGLHEADGLRWDAFDHTAGRLSGRALREAVPRADGLGVLTWPDAATAPSPPAPGAVREVLGAAVRGHDTVVVDLPRHAASAEAGGSEVVARADLLLVAVRPSLAGVAAAARVVASATQGPARVPVGLVLRGRGTDPAAVATALGAPVVAQVPERRRVGELVELGAGGVTLPGPLARAARDVLGLLGPAVAA
ncbi:septum site determining protein [Nocardioides zeae]|uniref:Septum site determining protein n=1 Tax=Nocardioides imazamoxiresistens TaxID=3231893 RepID=A0ABU3PZR2_9ACTN|nr:septum site-determining protein Ssd [Nocardioides zeae]MDT9594758.1 septum site determining protein [Nocardioides zeae]